jgi:hypothetical protein
VKLQSEHFPLPCSVKKRILQRYADPSLAGEAELAMDQHELLGYLRSMDYEEFSPLESILAQAEAIGDPALPGYEHTSILNWLGAAIEAWERDYALEEPLAGELRRLKPLLAALSVTEDDFLTPGAHPLHQLLDTIQFHAIGWQPRLGRLGQSLEQEVSRAVDAALAWFTSPATDLAAISTEMSDSAAKAQLRASKMAQRLIDAERGRIRVAQSKEQAAAIINAALEMYPAPAEIGEFLKGPWYESAQLVLLKFGKSSPEWEIVSRTTMNLLESLQPPPADQEQQAAHRQHIFELISQLEQDLGHWLLSLQHEGQAVANAVELVAFYHAKVLRKQSFELEKIPPIAPPHNPRPEQCQDQALNALEEGQWFILDTENSLSLRAKLVIRLDDEQQLLFTNQAGLKVLQKSFSEFARLMSTGKVIMLDTGASFSRCLARCAGLETEEDLDEHTGVAAEKARIREAQRQQAEQERARIERELAERKRIQLEQRQREEERLERLRREQELAEQLRREHEEAERLRREKLEQERQQLLREREEASQLQQKWEEACRQYRKRAELEQQEQRLKRVSDPEGPAETTDLNLPTGTWLGFRDGNASTLARLAVYNREQNQYIFVDRHGIKTRQLRGQQLMLLVARGLADILETRPRFREHVSRAEQQTAH